MSDDRGDPVQPRRLGYEHPARQHDRHPDACLPGPFQRLAGRKAPELAKTPQPRNFGGLELWEELVTALLKERSR